jgi:hypothetical protein
MPCVGPPFISPSSSSPSARRAKAMGIAVGGVGQDTMMPKRTWWMKRHDTINFVILGVIIVFIVWTTFFP